MTLYINACVRPKSRTNRLAHALLDRLGDFDEIRLDGLRLEPMTAERLALRTELMTKGDFSDPIFDQAKKFASAEHIVIAAPFWDLSFPAELKTYIENIFVVGLTSVYDENGVPHGLCKAKKLWYVTTAGGYFDPRFGYDYIKELVGHYFGISDTELIYAECLDLIGKDAEFILSETIKNKIDDKSFF